MSTSVAAREQSRELRDEARAEGGFADREATWRFQLPLGVFLLAVGVILISLVVALWPAVGAAATGKTRTVTWLGVEYTPTPDTALLVLVILVSALGSFIHAATSFTDYAGNRRLTKSWMWWYVLRVFVGSALALVLYFALRGGFFAADAATKDINPYGVAALAGLVGLFSKQATDKLREIFDTTFRVAPGYGDDAREDGIANPRPELYATEPPHKLAAGKTELVLRGANFVRAAVVRVRRVTPEAEVLPRWTRYRGDSELAVMLHEEDVRQAGILEFTVINPKPGGGSSEPLQIEVEGTAGTRVH